MSERLKVLINDVTESFYTNICRGLFEKDKLLFSFMIASKIQLTAGKINAKEWNFFLRGSLSEVEFNIEEMPKFITEKVYRPCVQLFNLTPGFKHLLDDLSAPESKSGWEKIMEAENPTEEKLPNNVDVRLDTFQKLLLYKILREEKLILSIKWFVLNTLGQMFIESPVFDLKGSFEDSSSTTPIIFILSPGADPISYLITLAKDKEMDTRLKMLSLGQGQGDIAK